MSSSTFCSTKAWTVNTKFAIGFLISFIFGIGISESFLHRHRFMTQSDDREGDLAFRAMLCPDIPPDLLPIYRFHLIHRKCYEIGTRGPCGSNMIFVKQPYTKAVGKCVCKPENINMSSRPLIHHRESGNCYFVYTTGFCGPEELVVLDDNDRPKCESNPCLELETITANEVEVREFVPLNGTCAEVGSVSGFCDLGQVVSFIRGRPGCVNVTLNDNEIS